MAHGLTSLADAASIFSSVTEIKQSPVHEGLDANSNFVEEACILGPVAGGGTEGRGPLQRYGQTGRGPAFGLCLRALASPRPASQTLRLSGTKLGSDPASTVPRGSPPRPTPFCEPG